jgi:hypothetical protein
MRSPFPGMDPYLESPEFWPDFHSTFINCWREAIAGLLPGGYEARLDERVSLVEIPPPEEWEAKAEKQIRPDVAITQRATHVAAASSAPTAVMLEPVTIPLIIDLEEVRETYIKILHRSDRSLVTVLELLSPTNKNDVGYGDYLSKRGALLRQRVHLVELDLLVGGNRVHTARPLPAGHYYAIVARSNRRPNADVYYWTIRDRLPAIKVPLKVPDPDLVIDLAAVFEMAFERGRYAPSLRYDAKPVLPLAPDELSWCAGLAAARSS